MPSPPTAGRPSPERISDGRLADVDEQPGHEEGLGGERGHAGDRQAHLGVDRDPDRDDRPDDPQPLQLAGLSNYRIGRYSEAIDCLERAASLREAPTEVDALLLSLSNAKLMRNDAAARWRDQALAAREKDYVKTHARHVDLQTLRDEAELILE